MKKLFVFLAAGFSSAILSCAPMVDYAQIKQQNEIACGNNNAVGCRNLGNMYYNGYGVPKNVNLALQYYDKACNLNDAESCNLVGIIYYRLDQQKNKDLYMKYFQKACDLNLGVGCYNIGSIYMAKSNLKTAWKYLDKACNLGYYQGCDDLKKIPKYKPTLEELKKVDYGEYPKNWKKLVKDYFYDAEIFIDPEPKIKFKYPPKKAYECKGPDKSSCRYFWKACVKVNARNRMGGYTGWTPVPLEIDIHTHKVSLPIEAKVQLMGNSGFPCDLYMKTNTFE
ncbi:tetratricopeptide repeat protein [Persephonella sp.]|uniref:tetratricopeptide repeat protein n=1 Tax=Persephonella sp. TaxID=2060922 RepID=UPI00260E42A0|nr:tetratricopeptide repeat protein [Persephonella sp.]